ncbi:ComF family protein [Pseudoalteromonas sp. A25]|uniref:ComF family protein n=1 Tax=Pseudoalteromonas sp. A25 TaxID=116092 RepID=UPI001260D525|nr:phosphoribosyltransferase family protein [Pseudoalteromonas sp. A25]
MLLNCLFSSRCACCQALINHNHSLCNNCLVDFPFFSPSQNNLLLRPDVKRAISLKYCNGLFACGWYQGWLQDWLSKYKFHKRTYLKQLLIQLIRYQMQRFWQNGGFIPDIYFFIPLSQTRYVARGYNQVTQTWLPALPTGSQVSQDLVRNKITKPQSQLSKTERRRNVKNAFCLSTNIQGKKVAIIDDVVTTGSTMDVAAHACLQAGAAQVWAFATSLTPLNSK